jgi:hypothetical protein
MDRIADRLHHAPVRVLTHIKKLDDCFGQFLVRVICDCGACREIEPEALARLVGAEACSAAATLLEVREEGRRGRSGCEAQTARTSEESALNTVRRSVSVWPLQLKTPER